MKMFKWFNYLINAIVKINNFISLIFIEILIKDRSILQTLLK